jgi:hypothetical protein
LLNPTPDTAPVADNVVNAPVLGVMLPIGVTFITPELIHGDPMALFNAAAVRTVFGVNGLQTAEARADEANAAIADNIKILFFMPFPLIKKVYFD